MTQKTSRLMLVVVSLLFIGLLVRPTDSEASAACSGEATAVQVQVDSLVDIMANIGHAGPLPITGGTDSDSLLNVPLPGGLGFAEVLSAFTTCKFIRDSSGKLIGGDGNSRARAAGVGLNVLGLVGLEADVISSRTRARCVTRGVPPTLTGSSVITNLTLNGSNVTVTGAKNQTIDVRDLVPLLPAGVDITLILNEQKKRIRDIDGDGFIREGEVEVCALRVLASIDAGDLVGGVGGILCSVLPLACDVLDSLSDLLDIVVNATNLVDTTVDICVAFTHSDAGCLKSK